MSNVDKMLYICYTNIVYTYLSITLGCDMMPGEKQVKSKKRVADHGEVFTAEREVKAMCDLVNDSCLNLDTTFLEPACGDGNFLAEILRRKLTRVYELSSYGKGKKKTVEQTAYEKNSITAICSLYGVDILEDNVRQCIDRLYNIWHEEYKKRCGTCNPDIEKSVLFILNQNILCGNALSLKKVNDKAEDTDEDIVFSEWKIIGDRTMHVNKYTLAYLLDESMPKSNKITDKKAKMITS